MKFQILIFLVFFVSYFSALNVETTDGIKIGSEVDKKIATEFVKSRKKLSKSKYSIWNSTSEERKEERREYRNYYELVEYVR